MKRQIGWIVAGIILFLCVLSFFTTPSFLWAGIANTKHNLSVSGPGAIKAVDETEICVFCHLPHNANPAVPLWSHNLSSAAYTMYSSEYLNRANYTVPTSLGQYPNAGYRSRLCLSCHDGTVAIGQVYVLRGQKLTSPINMQGVAVNGYMPTGAAGFIGTDLTNDHPVALVYDTSKSITFGSGSRNLELQSPGPPANPKPYEGVKLYSYPPETKGYVECPSCHDPHVENQKFLVIWNTNLGTTIGDLCNTCHDKDNWSASVHNTSASSYTEAAVQTTYGLNTISGLVCSNCHKPHGGPGSPYWYILSQQEETTCFKGAASASTGAPCHGTGAAAGGKNIEDFITRTYKHPTTTITGVHTDLDVLANQAGAKSFNWSSSKHAECVDCHNPHQTKQGNHTPDNQWYPSSVNSNTNLISNAIMGVTGVEPNNDPLWTPANTSYNTLNQATYEYQICLKCHSYFAFQTDEDIGTGVTNKPITSGGFATDQGMEFSQGNKSVHPVRVGLSSQTGSTAPQALTASQMSSPWSTNLGTQTMYCSDCHGTDNEASGGPKGPHGSTYKYMLKGAGNYWPYKSDGITLWKLNTTDAADSNLFCKNCHPIYDGTNWKNNTHGNLNMGSLTHLDEPCVSCHVAVPHGSRRSRLIGYGSSEIGPADVPPYNYSGNSLKVSGFKKASGPNNYAESNCYSTNGACSAKHTDAGGYDP